MEQNDVIERTKLLNERKKLRRKIFKPFKRLFIVGLVILLGMFLYDIRNDLSISGIVEWNRDNQVISGRGEGFPVDVIGNLGYKIASLGGADLVLSDTALFAVNGTGRISAQRRHIYRNPVLIESTDRRAILFDAGQKKYSIESVSKTLYSGTTEGNIFTADITENGSYAIASSDSNYYANVTLYNKHNEPVLIWESAEYRVVSVAVAPNGKGVAVAGIKAENGIIDSAVIILTADGTENRYTSESNMLLKVGYTSKNTVIAVGDHKMQIIDCKNDKSSAYPYNGLHLSNFDMRYNCGTVLALSKFDDRSEVCLVILDSSGTEKANIQTTAACKIAKIRSLYTYVYADNTIYEYNNKTSKCTEYEVGSDVSDFEISRSKLYVLGDKKLFTVKL